MLESDSDFRRRLKRLREGRGLSIRGLGRLAKVDNTYLGRLERGEYGPPKAQTVHRIAQALELDPSEESELLTSAQLLPASIVETKLVTNLDAAALVGATDQHQGLSGSRQQNSDELDRQLREAIRARQSGQVAAAWQTLENEVIPGFQRLGTRLPYVEALTALGDVYRVDRNYSAAETVFLTAKGAVSEVLGQARTDQASFLDTQLDWALTKISVATGNVRQARERIDRAWRAVLQAGHRDSAAGPAFADHPPSVGKQATSVMRSGFVKGVCAQVMARVYWAEGHPAEALRWFDRSLEFLAEGDAAHSVAETQMYRLLLLTEHAETLEVSHSTLVESALKTLVTAESGPYPHVVAMTRAVLARLYKFAGLRPEAAENYQQAVRLRHAPELVLAHPELCERFEQELAAAA